MKHKSIAATILALGIMISNAGIVSAHNDNFTAKNTVAYNEFLNLSSSQVRTMNATDEGQSKLDQLANNEDINSIKYFSSKGNNEAQISYNDNTGQYIYTESQDDSNSLLMIVDDEKYQVISKGENVYMLSEDGTEQLISEMIYEDDSANKQYDNVAELDDIESQISTYGYGKNYGPFYKTNKSLCTVLMVVSKTTKLFKWAHPTLGTISFVCKTVSKVGDKFVKTMYIKFYQAYDTAKPSNVRETQYWYYDSNHKNLAKSRTIKFSNTRPS